MSLAVCLYRYEACDLFMHRGQNCLRLVVSSFIKNFRQIAEPVQAGNERPK